MPSNIVHVTDTLGKDKTLGSVKTHNMTWFYEVKSRSDESTAVGVMLSVVGYQQGG